MTTRKPLVIGTDGRPTEVASTDKLGPFAGGTATGEAMTQDQFGTNYNQLTPTGDPQFGDVTLDAINGGSTGIAVNPQSTKHLTVSIANGSTVIVDSTDGDGLWFIRSDAVDDGGKVAWLTRDGMGDPVGQWVLGPQDDGNETFHLRNVSLGANAFDIDNDTNNITFGGSILSPTLVTPALGTPSSGTLTNCTGLPVASGISGLGTGIATWLATPSSANLASAVTDESGSGALIFGTSPTMTNATINQAANGNTALSMARFTNTSPTGKFLNCTDSTGATNVFSIDRFGAVAANITAQTGVNESVFDFTISDSGTVFSLANGTATDGLFNPSFFGTTAQGSEGVPVSFIGTKGVDTTTNPALLFFYRHNTGSGNADLSANVTGVEFRNRVTKAFGITGGHNVQLAGGTTSPTVAGATADIVSLCGFDRVNTRHAAAGNRLLAVQSERGSAIYLGDDALDFAASSAILSVGGTDIATLTTTSMTLADAFNIAVNASTGTKIGTATTQKLGFYNATPIVQRSGAAQAAVATTAATQTTPWGFSTQAQADAIVTLVNELRAWAVAQGFIKGSA